MQFDVKMNQAVFAFRRYEDASLRYTDIASHQGLTHIGLYDTVVAIELKMIVTSAFLSSAGGIFGS